MPESRHTFRKESVRLKAMGCFRLAEPPGVALATAIAFWRSASLGSRQHPVCRSDPPCPLEDGNVCL
jgi:hypothetical protein